MRNAIVSMASMIFLFLFSSVVFGLYPWDPLRVVSDMAASFDFITRFIVFILTVFIFLISVLAYSRHKSRKLLLVSLAFFFFSAKWALKVLDIFLSPGYFLADSSENVFELLILLLLFFAIFKK